MQNASVVHCPHHNDAFPNARVIRVMDLNVEPLFPVVCRGMAGVGKSWLACALGYKACRENLSVLYQRMPRLFAALALARGDGRYAKLLHQLARVDLLILDDWGPKPLLAEQQRDLLEIVEDRYNAGSLIITSQVPIDRWHEHIGNSTPS